MIDRPDISIRDTRAMPWEATSWVLPRALARVLVCDEDGDAVVQQRCLTAWTPPPERDSSGYRLAREAYFCLQGQFSHYECDVDGGTDDLVVFRPGVWMDRLPGSVTSGIVDVPLAVTGIGWLTDEDDPYVGLQEAAEMTETLEGASVAHAATGSAASAASHGTFERVGGGRAEPAGLRLATPYTSVWSSADMDWEDHPAAPGVRIKALSRRVDGDPTVMILGIPAGPHQGYELPWRGRHSYRELSYVLEGELRMRLFKDQDDREGEAVVLHEGYWIDRSPGSVYGYDAEESTPSGCTLLTFRLRSGVTLIKDRDKYHRYTRTLRTAGDSLSTTGSLEELGRLRHAGVAR